MAKGLVGGGASGIATLLAEAARTCACQGPELGTMVDLGQDTLGLQPDSWTASAFTPDLYEVGQPFSAGLEVWKYQEQTSEVRTLFRPLAAGDRVMVTWMGQRPVITGRLGTNAGDPDLGDPGGGGGGGGQQGPPGEAATITVGTTTTGAPGSSASVSNSGSSSAAVFDFVIPAGAQGQSGPEGQPGVDGAPGQPGAAATVTVGTTTTGAPGSDANVSNSGTTSAAVLNFTIPQGATGATGQQGPPGADSTVPGPPGNPGPPGQDSTVPGPPGPQGVGWVSMPRDPTGTDANYPQGTLWLNAQTGAFYLLTTPQGATPATWTQQGVLGAAAVDAALRAYIAALVQRLNGPFTWADLQQGLNLGAPPS